MGAGSAIAKRALDIVGGLLLSLFLTPLILLLAAGAALSLRAWPFFTQERIGRHGRPFRIVKIRTLPPQTPAYADKYAIRSVRVPWFCALLRAHHLDELPQLYLVPLGRMSLVGPRPEMGILHDRLDPAFRRLRTSVRPGCSGLWQVSEGASRLILETPEYDAFYVRNAGIRLDLWVLWRTLSSMLGAGRARSLEEIPSWALRRPREVINLGTVIELRTLAPVDLTLEMDVAVED